MHPQGELEIASRDTVDDQCDHFVLDDDDSSAEQKGSMHVHFAYSQPSEPIYHTSLQVPEQVGPGRSKRGFFFSGHGLDSSSSVRGLTDSPISITWNHHANSEHQNPMLSHAKGSIDDCDAPGQRTIMWSLNCREHVTGSHAVPQRAAKYRGSISPQRSRSPDRGSRASSTTSSSERREANSARRFLAAHGYQPHTLEEFRAQGYDAKRERYWTLGTLGADVNTEELQRKHGKAERIKSLSQNIRERNQATAESTSGRHPQSTKLPAPNPSPASTRERMQEYARNIQRAALHNRLPSPKRLRDHYGNMEAIGELEALHTQQKQQVEEMRKELVSNLEGLRLASD